MIPKSWRPWKGDYHQTSEKRESQRMQELKRHNLTYCRGKDTQQDKKWNRLLQIEEQAGYGKGRGTTEQVFILRNNIEQVNGLASNAMPEPH